MLLSFVYVYFKYRHSKKSDNYKNTSDTYIFDHFFLSIYFDYLFKRIIKKMRQSKFKTYNNNNNHMVLECQVCVEKMTLSRKVVCPYCEYTCCRNCAQTYILSSADDANCMNCRRIWDREILLQLFTKKFVMIDYKNHRENMLLDRETAMMPSTQPYVDQEIQRRRNVDLLRKLADEKMKLKRKIREIDDDSWQIQRQLVPPLQNEKRSFIHKCGLDGCNGFLSTAYKCNICLNYTCPDCNAIKGKERDVEHVCNEDDKLTMQLLKNDCKKCPGCAQFIFKVSGCDQMWCTNCQTAFSWRTGLKVNGQIHNPHFYEFQRRGGMLNREAGDIPCGGLPSYRELHNIFNERYYKSNLLHEILQIHRILVHIEHVELGRYPTEITHVNNCDLRIQLMLKEISIDSFKSKLQQREKASQKKKDIGLIFGMFLHTMSDLYRQMAIEKKIEIYYEQIKELIKYMNSSMFVVANRYDCIVPIIQGTQLVSSKMVNRGNSST